MSEQRKIHVTDRDMERLEKLISVSPKNRNVLNLEEELGRAVVVPASEISSNVVTMNSKVSFKDEGTGEESVVTLVYPQEADVEEAKVSVLAPIGSALLGLSVGDTIEWPMPNGKSRVLRILSVLDQPKTE